jgi:hypothetical protein
MGCRSSKHLNDNDMDEKPVYIVPDPNFVIKTIRLMYSVLCIYLTYHNRYLYDLFFIMHKNKFQCIEIMKRYL